MNAEQVGILLSVGAILTIFVLPIWSSISDKTGNRRAVLKVVTLGVSLGLLLYMLPTDFWSLLIVVTLFMSFHDALQPLTDAIVISYLSKTNIKFSAIRIGGTIGFASISLIAGHINAYSTNLTFILGSIILFILFLLTWKLPQVKIEKKEKRKLDFRKLFQNKKVIYILFIAFAFQVAQGFYFGFLGIYIVELGYTSREIGWANFIGVLFEIPVFFVIDRALRRFTVVPVTLFCIFTVVVRMFLLYAAGEMGLWMVYLSMFGAGVSFIGFYYSCATFINSEMDDDMKSSGQSMLALSQLGFGSITGTMLGGFIAQNFGIRFSFLYFGIGLGIVCLICSIVFSAIGIKKRLAML
jgi:PPP family 3-phenylpropionic acid transporter